MSKADVPVGHRPLELGRVTLPKPVPVTGPRCDGVVDRVTLGSRHCCSSNDVRLDRAQPGGSPQPSRAVRRLL